ncbi:hypothetical protein RHABOEDO_000956 [Candidatus Rhabdochlamydia oedothoracis]|uniref:Uncharacterized protein n=1 Tax=Candidatus Rhabdochlamydia oedothoracis TaxID=2720720 RepID=A0ABX8V686_9BACT|nr:MULTISPECIES: hypothetical protein [Rhabdochlamydia]KAG6559743.1 hypothetical protein RHOW815_000238 [Candidatus Rhabdochlamydia sp. W815]MCL6755756.1 hypothetical protein [Candidatus Rhabdochlamydia oedothoracis]QYF48744.1 hypothetical protein RHABOEDO_000956 [Candidatus Rhabdochlamydia oedothoracis]
MSTKQLGGQSTSRTKQLGSPKINKQLNVRDTSNKELEIPTSIPVISSIAEEKIDKPQTVNSKQDLSNRFEFYVGKERMTLRNEDLQRIRELQDSNDQLQRQVAMQKQELFQVADSLKLSAEIEQAMCMIARNAGEVLSLYSDNESRLRRISALENKNINLQQDMSDLLGKVATCHEMHQKTQFAKEYFLKKAEYDRNTAEIQRLK